MKLFEDYFGQSNKTLSVATSQQVPKLRTVEQTIKELKVLDQGCQITDYALRQWMRKGKIKALSVNGNKQLIYWDSLLNFLRKGVN
ncbi:MAG: hypothetical protein LBM01_02870 [Christensenellaceae bacterium]|jgi:hypothetical protein|nr:hypothetical protein [Christensenellaceae bacterium]